MSRLGPEITVSVADVWSHENYIAYQCKFYLIIFSTRQSLVPVRTNFVLLYSRMSLTLMQSYAVVLITLKNLRYLNLD